MAAGSPWGTTGRTGLAASPTSLLFSSSFLGDSSNAAAAAAFVTEQIFPEPPSSSWNEDRESEFLDGNNKSIPVSTVMDTVGFTLQVILNGTRGMQADQGLVDISTFASATTTASSNVDIMGLTFSTSPGEDIMQNDSSPLTTPSSAVTNSQSTFPGKNVIIPLYSLIFVLSFVGNLMVILTLARNRRMRTVTNILLLNLAVSDLLLGVFCMPVTLIGQLRRNFIFGAAMCRLLPYFQGVSVSVSCWTLCAISLERYFAICRPLQSRKWQTRSHAYKMILAVWLFSLTWNLPITFASTLQPIRNSNRYKCREIWPSEESEKIFNLVLDFILLLIPLFIMGIAYSLIVNKLWKGLQSEIRHTRSFRQHGPHGHLIPRDDSLELSTQSPYVNCKLGCPETSNSTPCNRMCMTSTSNQTRESVSNEIVTLRGGKGVVVRWRRKNAIEVADTATTSSTRVNCSRCTTTSPDHHHHHHHHHHHCTANNHTQSVLKQNGHGLRQSQQLNHLSQNSAAQQPPSSKLVVRAIRSTYTGKSMESKKKVIRMLFVLIAEFFICWCPLYLMNTWYLFDSESVYNLIGSMGVSLIQLLSFSSSCSNPITYCFMNRKFRQAFKKVFQCSSPRTVTKAGQQTIGRGSDMSANDSLIYGAPPSTLNKSVLVLECENRV